MTASFMPEKTVILLTGPPGIGKTTLVRRVCEVLEKTLPARLIGFLTEEVRGGAGRLGFDIVCLPQPGEEREKRGPLARLSAEGDRRGPMVGRYRVDIGSFERLALPAIENVASPLPVVHIIDEIGKMELISRNFEARIRQLIASSSSQTRLVLLATVPLSQGGKPGLALVEELKRMSGVQLIQVSHANREGLVATIVDDIKSAIQL